MNKLMLNNIEMLDAAIIAVSKSFLIKAATPFVFRIALPTLTIAL